MQTLTKEQVESIIKTENDFIHYIFSLPEIENEVKKAIDRNEFPETLLVHNVDHDRRTQYRLSLEVRCDLNVYNYPEVVAVEATSGSLCGSCWAEYSMDVSRVVSFNKEVQDFLEKIINWIFDNIKFSEKDNFDDFSKLENKTFEMLGY